MFIVTHKSLKNKIIEEGYSYLGVSRKANDADFHDDTLDNISIKNPFYCELTALYWIWKNIECENVGLCHYRRFFVDVSDNKVELATIKGLDSVLCNYDIVVPKVSILKTSVKKHYEMNVKNDGLSLICKKIAEKDPSYIPHIKKVLVAKECFYCNMFYTRKEIINDYCNWLFDVLENLEAEVDMAGWSQYEQRLYGFLSEVLFNIWISHRELTVFHKDFFKTETFPVMNQIAIDYRVKYNRKTKLRIVLWPLVKRFGNFRRIED